MEPFYRKILKRAFAVSWKNKWLWILGFFAAFLGNLTFGEAILRGFNNLTEGASVSYTLSTYLNDGAARLFAFRQALAFGAGDWLLSIISFFWLSILILLGVIVLVFAVIGQAGVVRSAIVLDEGKRTNLPQGYHFGVKKFWSILGVNLLMRAVLIVIGLALAFLASIKIFNVIWLEYFVYVLAFIALLLAAIVVYFLTIYSTAYIILRHRKVFPALVSAWKIFRKNVLLNLEIGIILFVINVLALAAIVVVTLFALSPLILLYFLFILLSAHAALAVVTSLILAIAFIAFILGGAWLTTFQLSTWAILFEELELNQGQAKIVRVIAHVKKKLLKRKKRR